MQRFLHFLRFAHQHLADIGDQLACIKMSSVVEFEATEMIWFLPRMTWSVSEFGVRQQNRGIFLNIKLDSWLIREQHNLTQNIFAKSNHETNG